MKISDLLRMCADNLRRRKARSILTIIGVVVGTCSIVVMISFGVAIDIQQEEMMQGMGDLTQIEVYNWNTGGGSTPALDDNQVQTIRSIEGVLAATPIYYPRYFSAQIFAGKNDRYAMGAYNLVGMYPDAVEALGYELISGNYLPMASGGTIKELQVLVGEKAAYSFQDTRKTYNNMIWPDPDPITGELPAPFFDINKEKLVLKTDLMEPNSNNKQLEVEIKVVGMMKEDTAKGYYTSQGMIVDITVLKKLEEDYMKLNNIKGVDSTGTGYDNVIVKVDDVNKVSEVEQQIKDMGYETWSMQTIRDQLKESTRMIQLILGGLGAISMFVAALSIMNTMTMAIYERTKEIGVMKVLGCKLGDIRTMFLIEAGMIGFMGGVVGIGISFLISFGLNQLGAVMNGGVGTGSLSIIPLWLILLGLGFSTIVGLLSGLAPANRAVRISALEAIRHE